MPDPVDLARRAYVQRALLARRAGLAVSHLWRSNVTTDAIAAGANAVTGRLIQTITDAQLAAAQVGADGAASIIAAQNIPAGDLRPVPAAFAGTASDGRPLGTLVERARIDSLIRIAQGQAAGTSLAIAGRWLQLVAATQVQDAGRGGAGVATAANKHVGGYYRYLTPPSCSRCAVLAGKWFKWNTGFKRHPRCDCIHLPANDGALDSEKRLWSPESYFASLSASEQERVFTKAGAKAIRDGADVNQVVNARRGMRSASVFGRDLTITSEGTSVRGLASRELVKRGGTVVSPSGTRTLRRAQAPRLMPESIYDIAGDDRDEALRLLRINGFVVPR